MLYLKKMLESRLIFGQPHASERLGLVRISLALTCLVLIYFGPYDQFYAETSKILYTPGFPLYIFPNLGDVFFVLKILTGISGLVLLFGYKCRFSSIVFAVLFFLLNYYVANFSTSIWNYNTSLNFFLFAHCFSDGVYNYSVDSYFSKTKTPKLKSNEKDSFILFFMQLTVVTLYFQSGLSKLIFAGTEWFLNPNTLMVFTSQMGTSLGKSALHFPFVFKFFALATIIFEIGFLFAFLFRRTHKILGLLGIFFHLGIYSVMNISFWFLWIQYPALFLIKNFDDLGNSKSNRG